MAYNILDIVNNSPETKSAIRRETAGWVVGAFVAVTTVGFGPTLASNALKEWAKNAPIETSTELTTRLEASLPDNCNAQPEATSDGIVAKVYCP